MREAKRRIGLFLLIGVVLAAAVAWTVRSRLNEVEGQLGKRSAVYVAAHEIPAQKPLAEADLKTVSIPNSFMQPGMLTDKKEIIGKVSVVSLSPNEPVSKNLLISRTVVPDGHRIVRLFRSQGVQFDDNLMAGDRVDLVATYTDMTAKQPQLVTTVFLASLPVVETDTRAAWVGIQVTDKEATGLVQLESTAKVIQLLRLSPPKGGAAK